MIESRGGYEFYVCGEVVLLCVGNMGGWLSFSVLGAWGGHKVITEKEGEKS